MFACACAEAQKQPCLLPLGHPNLVILGGKVALLAEKEASELAAAALPVKELASDLVSQGGRASLETS